MKRLAVAFSGRSGSGKTTLIKKIAQNLIKKGFKVAIIKHDPGDKAVFDTPKKDSYEFSALGANVAVVGPKRTAIFLKEGLFGGMDRIKSSAHAQKSEKFAISDAAKSELKADLERIISLMGDFDYLLVEGLKYIPLPRIVVFRGGIDEGYLEFSDAVASDLDDDFSAPKFGLDDTDGLIEWIDKNAQKCKG